MRYILQQLLVRGHYMIQLFGHAIEVPAQFADFIAAPADRVGHAHFEIAAGEWLRRQAQAGDGRRQIPGESITNHAAGQQRDDEAFVVNKNSRGWGFLNVVSR
jgi:hypothetical protein